MLLFPSDRKTCGHLHVHGTGFTHLTGETVTLFNRSESVFGRSYNQAQMWYVKEIVLEKS